MRNILIYTLAIFLNGCITETNNCGYKPLLVAGRHYLNVPIHIIPNKLIYKLGDTITIRVDISDSILDINTGLKFKIKNFPFKPVMGIYNFDSGGAYQKRGFGNHEVLIDSIYNPYYQTFVAASTLYEDNRYRFEIMLILKTRGKYVFLLQDAYEINSGGGNPQYLNTYADTIDFEGKCQDWKYSIDNMIQGDDHILDFGNELVYIDKELNFDNFSSLRYPKANFSPYGSGIIAFERVGTYCFEVK